MPAKKTKTPKAGSKADASPANELWTASTGSKNNAFHMARIAEIQSSLWLHEGMSKEDRLNHTVAALNMFSELKPQNGLEGMLATQMVATHSAAMECFRRAMLPEQTAEGRDLNLKNANKLVQTFARQMEVLDKHRGKGQQKITVEHVTVEAGGQAIVGNVSTAANAKPEQSNAPSAIAHQPAEMITILEGEKPGRVPAPSRRARTKPSGPE